MIKSPNQDQFHIWRKIYWLPLYVTHLAGRVDGRRGGDLDFCVCTVICENVITCISLMTQFCKY